MDTAGCSGPSDADAYVLFTETTHGYLFAATQFWELAHLPAPERGQQVVACGPEPGEPELARELRRRGDRRLSLDEARRATRRGGRGPKRPR